MIGDQSLSYLQCLDDKCGERYPIDQRRYVCDKCRELLDVQYDFLLEASAAQIKTSFHERRLLDGDLDRSGVWRFRELLPFAGDFSGVVTLGEGNTPIYRAERSASYAGLDGLRFKHQGLNPTGSFKDNGMTTGVTQAAVLGARAVACASTGNTSASMAAYAARAGMSAFVFIPAGEVAYGKLSQSLEYGARVIEIEGNFDDSMRLVRELADETDLYLLNSINPFRLEGQKTIIIEMMEQCGWQPPDWIVLPGGNLGNTSAFGKALHELARLGFIDRMPRLAVIQAAGAAPFYDLYTSSDWSRLNPVAKPATLATAIRIGEPVSWRKALRSLAWTNGVVERVTEQQIADAKAIIGLDGIGCEPASGATLAGIKRLVASRVIESSADVVAVLTGNLLKDPSYTIDYHTDRLAIDDEGGKKLIKGLYSNRPTRVAANKDAIKKVLGL
ncbi:MAG TPA: threonine synthase [Blastocatellia bacterium]|nr:threonine synthase [Blastocatellia bacterium]